MKSHLHTFKIVTPLLHHSDHLAGKKPKKASQWDEEVMTVRRRRFAPQINFAQLNKSKYQYTYVKTSAPVASVLANNNWRHRCRANSRKSTIYCFGCQSNWAANAFSAPFVIRDPVTQTCVIPGCVREGNSFQYLNKVLPGLLLRIRKSENLNKTLK